MDVQIHSYYRPYRKLGTHIKTHAITPEAFQMLKASEGPFQRALYTEYYTGRRIYSVIDRAEGRTIHYRELLSQESTPLKDYAGLECFKNDYSNSELVVEQSLRLNPETWVNHFQPDLIRQKLVLEGAMYSLEILLDQVGPKEDLLKEPDAENILSLSYVLKPKAVNS
jgi:hypothetical protein